MEQRRVGQWSFECVLDASSPVGVGRQRQFRSNIVALVRAAIAFSMRRSSASSLSASVPQLQPPRALQLAAQRRAAAWLQLAGATSSQAIQG